jgi:hypothetical protein
LGFTTEFVMAIDRRQLLHAGGIAALSAALPKSVQAQSSGSASASPQGAADHTIRIGNGLVELAPDRIISTTTYNGQFPGPLLRFKEGQQVVVDIHNDTDTPEQLHWHGQTVPSDVDGASEEGTPFIPVHGERRIASPRDPLDCDSITRTSRRVQICPADNMADKSVRSTSSRNASRAATIAKYF